MTEHNYEPIKYPATSGNTHYQQKRSSPFIPIIIIVVATLGLLSALITLMLFSPEFAAWISSYATRTINSFIYGR